MKSNKQFAGGKANKAANSKGLSANDVAELKEIAASHSFTNSDGEVIEFEISSGNVFEDLGRPNADELALKADLAFRINRSIQARKWTQKVAAEALGLQQPDVSALRRGKLRGFSVVRLFEILNKLGHRVEVHVSEDECCPEEAQTLVCGV